MVLHRLADVLSELGEHVVLVTGNVDGEKKYPVITQEVCNGNDVWRPSESDWTIYPEIVDGNPLNGPNVVRWLLNIPKARGGSAIYGKDDLFFHYSHNFCPTEIESSGHLHVADYGLSFFKSEKRTRLGLAIMVRKSRDYRMSHLLERAGWPVVDFLSGLDRRILNRYFNSLAIFVSYDTETYHSIQAALSGAISIVIPRKERSRRDFYSHGAMRYGVAYGLRGIPWALLTRKRLRSYLEEMESRDRATVVTFVNHLKRRSY